MIAGTPINSGRSWLEQVSKRQKTGPLGRPVLESGQLSEFIGQAQADVAGDCSTTDSTVEDITVNIL